MKKVLLASLVLMTMLSSCFPLMKLKVLPQTASSVNAVTLKELNLQSSDYTVHKTISAEASILVKYVSRGGTVVVEVRDLEKSFSYTMFPDGKGGFIMSQTPEPEGILRAGYLTNDYGKVDLTNPEDVARRLAIYKIISMSQQIGADGLIEPVISTTVEQVSTDSNLSLTYKTTVSAKPIKLKVTGE